MQKILVPTDFSDGARQALDYAVAIANKFDSEITLYHVFKMRVTSRSFVSIDSLLKEEAEEKLGKIIDEVKPQIGGGSYITGVAMKEGIVMSIAHRSQSGQYDLIVMGTEGASELIDLIMGSTAVGVIDEVECPVLVVPQVAPYDGIHSLVFALDELGIKKTETLQPLIKLAAAFDIPIKIFHKTDPKSPADIEELARQLFPDVDYQLHCETTHQSTTESILDYAKKEKADLLCLVRKKRDFLEKVFHASVTRENVMRSQVPMLILKEE